MPIRKRDTRAVLMGSSSAALFIWAVSNHKCTVVIAVTLLSLLTSCYRYRMRRNSAAASFQTVLTTKIIRCTSSFRVSTRNDETNRLTPSYTLVLLVSTLLIFTIISENAQLLLYTVVQKRNNFSFYCSFYKH